jgi:hypothetical protein
MSPTNTVTTAEGEGEPVELPLREIRKRHKDKWVAVIVTKRDRNLQPTRGKVVAEDMDRFLLRQKLGAYPDICIFFAGDSIYPPLL